ncbi:hypothetical protein DNTS_034839 [Danionella cerebrum]|uniref:C3/C5 convertase n=1 Tax=Danionella cerebrum TaxID=2873325 RepID=A0A553MLW3_9TELE|nr:hypothetical protein DNTS_034839 [Danionella translucida]
MASKPRLKWLLLVLMVPLAAGAPSLAAGDGSCPQENIDISGGSFILTNSYSPGSILKYRCDLGYYPSIPTRRCQYGTWIPKPITKKPAECKRVTCPNPRVLENGEVFPHQPKYYVNDTTEYSCHTDYTFSGSRVRICKENGKWNGSTPICGHNSDYCADPGVPPGSSRTGNDFKIDHKVTYRCDSKLTLIGSKERVCLDGGMWSGTEPQCYDQTGKKIALVKGGKLDIYIGLDASNSITKEDFDKAKEVIKTLIKKISYYEISPNYEILMFASDVERIVSITDFKNSGDARLQLQKALKDLDDFQYKKKGDRTGTNIGKLYTFILESMSIEKGTNSTMFLETQHVIIVFTDGHSNMGGNPKPKVDLIRNLVIGNQPERENKLELFVFGVGEDVKKDDMNGLNYNCMGSLVTSSYILTAAHCFKENPSIQQIKIKLDKMNPVEVKRYIIPKEYDTKKKEGMGINEFYDFDIALIELTLPVKMSFNLRPICIPCTKETNGALKLTDSEGTCKKHEEMLLSKDLVEASFTSKMTENRAPRKIRNIIIKQGKHRDACVKDALKAEGINTTDAYQVVTKNFLCSGGTEPYQDDVSCKGESGGATFMNQKDRLIQVGIVSWGTKNLCTKGKIDARSTEDSRDYHISLFSPEIQAFLKAHLGNDKTESAPSLAAGDGSCPQENIDISGGSFILTNSYSPGSVLKYRCDLGYYPSIPTRRCQYGTWIPKPDNKKSAECKRVTCPNPNVLENGEVSPHQKKYYVNDTTEYSCNSDYKFSGSRVRICKENGKWNGSTPICGHNSDYCADPGVPPGSSRTGNEFKIGFKVTYRCDSPLTLIGSKERVCLDGAMWSGTEPQCYAGFTYDTVEEASEGFSSSLKSSLTIQQETDNDQTGKKIALVKGGKLDIYIGLDASDSIEEEDFDKAKEVIKTLIDKISYYDVSPNYEILMFATDVTRIVSITDFKTSGDARLQLQKAVKDLDDFKYDKKGDRTGTNIGKLYTFILESMNIENQNNRTAFLETQHIIIVFTDGQFNMGGKPKPKVDLIRNLVIDNKPERENKLELYVFGVGEDVKKDDMNGLISERLEERHFFALKDLGEMQETFDSMIDDSTIVGLCGIHQTYDAKNPRRKYPWLVEISLGTLTCMGSLVTSSYILTAAHCFKENPSIQQIRIKLDKMNPVEVKRYIIPKEYDTKKKEGMGINEFYDFDIALIELTLPVKMSFNLRPICIPCTKETNGALKLTDSEGTCKKHEEMLLSKDLVDASFTSKMIDKDRTPRKIRNIIIKQGKHRDACVKDALKAEGISTTDAYQVVTKNFLCSGGTEPNQDDISCKGESGGATFVGIVSWGTKNLCTKDKIDAKSTTDSRDYHISLFSPEIQAFLKAYLGNDKTGSSLTFLPQ